MIKNIICKIKGHNWTNFKRDIEVNEYGFHGDNEVVKYRVIVARKCECCKSEEQFMTLHKNIK